MHFKRETRRKERKVPIYSETQKYDILEHRLQRKKLVESCIYPVFPVKCNQWNKKLRGLSFELESCHGEIGDCKQRGYHRPDNLPALATIALSHFRVLLRHSSLAHTIVVRRMNSIRFGIYRNVQMV